MVRTNLQEFAGDVHVLSNLQVGSNLFANDLAANVLNVIGSIGANLFVGDGGLLSNIATTLDDIIDQGNTVSNTVIFVSGNDATSNTGIITRSNVGISISNTEPTGEYQLTVGSNIFMNAHASNVLSVVGRVGADYFVGDGGLLSNIATTLDQIVDQGNTISNTVILESGQDTTSTSNIGLISRENVGISVSNSNPTGEFQFGVGSNLFVNTYSSNVLTVEGNVLVQKMSFGTAAVTSAYNLSHVTAQGSVTGETISLTNATTGLAVTSNLTAGGNVTAETLISTANVEVGDRLKFASNVFVDDLRVADLAANLVTYDKTTGELMDSGGLFANKLAVVSVQPPSALDANTVTIAKHGTYTVTTSGLAAYSNAWNAFDGDSAVEWTSTTVPTRLYDASTHVYNGTSNLFAGNYIQTGVASAGEWLAIEFPYKTTLRHMKLTPPATVPRYPTSANLYATNDSLTWTELTNWSGVNPGSASNVQTITVNATESFKKYALVATKSGGATNVALGEWKLFTESFSIDGGKVAMATSAVMGGETTVDQHGPHGRGVVPLKKYPEIIFENGKFDKDEGDTSSNTYVQAGYTVSASSHVQTSDSEFDERQVWRLFDGLRANGTVHEGWMTKANSYEATGLPSSASPTRFTGDQGQWAELMLPHKIKLQRFSIAPGNNNNSLGAGQARFPKVIAIHGYDGSSWTRLQEFTTTQVQSLNETQTFEITAPTGYHEKFVLVVKQTWTADIPGSNSSLTNFDEWKLYGYEEDPPAGDTSVDTTFTSIMNTPQTTGANVYVDGSLGETFTNRVTGPTPVGTAAVHDNTNKYWELTGELTSNVTLEANTFLEGDQPHAVSVWFNSSNLEANVSNTCVFSVSDQEHLNSQNLDLQSNTWHNLTYAYQGEGGSRVTYLDGRKVAEDQAEDTFGDYPPFAMTGYSQGGYVVSASSEHSAGTVPVWKAFDDTPLVDGTNLTDTFWQSAVNTYDSSGNWVSGVGATGVQFTDTNGGQHSGEWFKLEMPHKLRLNYISYLSTYGNFLPKNFVILGSNDDNTWTLLKSVTGGTAVEDVYHNLVINADRSYKYYVWLTSAITGTGGEVLFANLKFYGHRENDLVRLPDPTRVLKYPHIAMTGPAQRGYVASASADNYNSAEFYTYSAFNNIQGNEGWHGGANDSTTVYHFSANAGGSIYDTSKGGSLDGNSGEWLKLELPHKIVVDYIKLKRRTTNTTQVPKDFKILGSNNDVDWDILQSVTGASTDLVQTHTIGASTGYKYLAILVTRVHGTVAVDVVISELEYYGTGVDSVPIQIGGGNIDKVANFRVYDRFIGEDQALEIWDAQKDEFERAKSSMTLQKGRLGIGTDEPQGRLAVLDEPHNLEEFPPRAMTGYKTYFEGHGEFCVSASELTTGTNGTENVFDKKPVDSGASFWLVGSGAGYNTSTGIYEGESGVVYSLASETPSGHYITLELPYRIKLEKYSFGPRYGAGYQTPKDWELWGSDNGKSWTKIHNVSGNLDDKQTLMYSVPQQTGYYKYMGFIVTKTISGSADYMAIGELRYFGTREQGQSVLHDGQLTLTKNLNVPRIGPALDADDTPRRDRLVVEYNTSTNPTFEGAVRDTSGRGNDGVFVGTASYDATEKAFTGFTRVSSKTISTPIHNTSGDYNFSVSTWVKPLSYDGNQGIFNIGPPLGTNTNLRGQTAVRLESSGFLKFYVWGYGTNNSSYTYKLGAWIHIVATYSGGSSGQKLYVDGAELILDSGTQGELNLLSGAHLHIGHLVNGSGELYGDRGLNGSISNFKLYDTVLTAEEVKTLYDMGRCDEGHHVVNFSKTRVGIGLGDGEAPRGALDVREQGIFRDILFDQRNTDNNNSVSVVRYRKGGEGGNYWKNWVNASNHYYFNYNGTDSGYFASSGPNSRVQNFTGQHRTFIKDVPFSQAGDLEGLIVSSDQNKYIKMSGGIEAGSNAITTNESLPIVSLSTTTNDKKCFGVISASEDPETREDTHGILTSIFEKERGDTRVYINSVGEGAIWVVNTNGSLESGDYITTSNVAGYGQKQEGAGLMNYTVAKITMDCDFEPATQPVQQILRSNVVETYYLGNVHHTKTVPHEFVTTTVGADDTWSNVSVSPSDVTYAEWSNLEANTQNTYTLTYTQTSNVVYDTKYTLTTTANVTESDPWDNVYVDPPSVTYAEYSNLEANTQNTYSLTFTQTTTDTKTPEEWSALESNTQSLYNKVYYQSVEEEVAADVAWGDYPHTGDRCD